jgi:rhodanese-related sulfurtransferase
LGCNFSSATAWLSHSRGVLEGACVWNYDDTIPQLAEARNQNIVLICRSGNRSVLAALTATETLSFA